MPEEIPVPQKEREAKPAAAKKTKGGKWFRKIPKEILFSPGGITLLFLALIMEIIDWIPIPGFDSLTWELILEIIFCIFLAIIAKIPFQSMVIPLIIERIPVVSDILPTWLIRMFI